MRVTVEIQVSEIRKRFGRAVRRHLTPTDEASQALSHFDVHQVWRVQLLLVPEQAGLDPDPERCLQEQLQQGRGVQDDHAESRSSRMTIAAGVFSDTRLRLWSLASISSRVGRAARRSSSARR